MSKSQAEEQQLVIKYLESGDRKIKHDIVAAFAPMIKYIIKRFNVSYSNTFSVDDLYQYGVLGLLKALDRYQKEFEVPFKSFAYKRVQGEVIDALRKEGMLGRDKYEQVKNLEKSIQALSSGLGREPDTLEICEHTGLSQDEYHALAATAQLTYTVSLNTKVADSEGGFIYKIDSLVDENQVSPEEKLIKKNLKEKMHLVVDKLPEREKIILALYFYEELTMADIGRIIDVSEARVSQILSKTLLSIRSKLYH